MLDRLLAAFLILLVSPILLLSAIAIVLESGGPVLFRQQRVGLNKHTFSVLKLRTMTLDANRVTAQTYENTTGVTITGRFLRRWKIDELPQLFNVLCGDMSIVGPRPCLEELLADMDEKSLRRFLVKPGLTGLAQVNGNIALSWPERWVYDVEYVQRIGPYLDLKILLKTISVIITGERLNSRG